MGLNEIKMGHVPRMVVGNFALSTETICINVNSDSVVLDGNNLTVTSNGQTGVQIRDHKDVVIKNMGITNFTLSGIELLNSSNISLINNNLIRNNNGIMLQDSSNNTIYDNYFNNTRNSSFSGVVFSNYWNITETAGKNIIGGSNLGGNF